MLAAEFHHVFCGSAQIACNKCLSYAAFVEILKTQKKPYFFPNFKKTTIKRSTFPKYDFYTI